MSRRKSADRLQLAAATALFVFTAGVALADNSYSDLPPGLAKAAQAFDDAQLRGNGSALRQLLSDDYRLINGGGIVENKEQFIRDYSDPNFRMLPFTVKEPVHIAWDSGAVLGGKVNMRWIDHGKQGSKLMRFADIWSEKKGVWKVVYTQVTRMPGP